MKRPLTPVQQHKADTMAACKTPYKDIADKLGVTIGAVRDYFNGKDKKHE